MILFFLNFASIHEMEYKKYLKEAVWTEVETRKQKFIPLQKITKGTIKNYYGYLLYWVDTSNYKYFQMKLLTHIAYFAVNIDASTGELGSIPNLSRFNTIRDYAHQMGVKIHMTFIIFGTSSVTNFLNNTTARINAINNISNFITNYGCDGVNIDFEYVSSAVRDSFNKFINDIAYELWHHPNGRKELFLATPAVPEWYPGYDISYLSTHSDGLFIMAYDYHWSGSDIAGPVSPCVPSSFWGQYSVAKTIGSYKDFGVDGSKIILGLPYYGYDWPTVSGNIGANTTGTGSAVIYYYAFQNANNYGMLWDSYSLTPWYRYYTTEWHQCWYDDSVSFDIKLGMVTDSLLQGGGCWALGYDRSYDHLWNQIRKNFWIEPPERHYTVEVILDNLNVRDGPDPQYNILTTAIAGTKLVAFDYYNYWHKVYFPSNAGPYYAWVWSGDGIDYQYMKGTTQNTILRVSVNLLNVREGPDISYPIITRIANGQVFVSDSFYGNWARIYLPIINGYSMGWIYYPYTNIITNPEDYNNYNCDIIVVDYPSIVEELDTFSVVLKIKNKGFAPFDSLIYLKSDSVSPFFDSLTWIDTTKAKTYGFNGLPNQTFYIYSLFRAPEVLTDSIVSDTFRLGRKNTLFGPEIIVTITVTNVGIIEKETKKIETKIIKNNIFSDKLRINLQKNGEISIYDICGRKLQNKKLNKGNITICEALPSGVYYLFIKLENKVIKEKIIKIK